MGDRKKRVKFDDEIEPIERRRSSRIIALEEKKKEEKERKKALELERKNKAKDKGKARIYEVYELSNSSDEDDEQGGPNQKGCRGEALHQPIKQGQQAHNGSASRRTNVSFVPDIEILKDILEVLLRDDPAGLFAMPATLDVEENDCSIIKQPMDFATILAKMYDGSYTSLALLKRDVYLMCSNAMLINPPNSRPHKVAKIVKAKARRLFDEIYVEPKPEPEPESEHCDLELSLSNTSPSRKQQGSQPRTSRSARAPPKPAGRNNVAVSEADRRDTYLSLSSNPSIFTECQQMNKPNIQGMLTLQLVQDASKYKDSVLKFVEDLGPAAKRAAARKIQAVEFQLLPNNGIDSSASPSLNGPLTILPDTSTQENLNANTNAGDVNISDATYLRNTIEDWDAHAAALLANSFLKNDKGGSKGGCESSNARSRTLDIGNVFPTPNPFQKGTSNNHEPQKGPTNAITGSTRSVSTHVWPTVVIPRAESIAGSSSSRPSLTQQLRPQGSRPNFIDLPNYLSLLQQPMTTQSMSGINPLGASILPQQMITHSNPRSNNSNNHHRARQHVIMPQHVAHFANEPDTSLYALGTPCVPGNFQALLGPQDRNNSPYPTQQNQQQVMHQAAPYTPLVTPQSFHPSLPMQVLNQMNLQAPFHMLQQQRSSSTLQTPFGSALIGGGAASTSQQGEASTGQPNLSLGL